MRFRHQGRSRLTFEFVRRKSCRRTAPLLAISGNFASLQSVSDFTYVHCFFDLEISLSGTCTVSNDTINTAPSTSIDIQYVGTIEVVVLRCYPMDKPIKPASSRPVQSLTPNQRFRQRVPTVVASSVASSSNESWSDDNRSQPGLGGLFDGTDDKGPLEPRLMNFGGDASWDNTGQGWDNGQTWQQQAHSPQWNNAPTNNNTSTPGQEQAASVQWDSAVSTSCN